MRSYQHRCRCAARFCAPKSGFTLVELLTVIVILLILIGLLLTAIRQVQISACRTSSQSQLTSLATAIESYAMSFGSLPGYADESAWTAADQQNFTATENMVVSLLGLAAPAATNPVAPAPPGFGAMQVDRDRIGNGPQTRTNRQFGAFYAPKVDELAEVIGTTGADNNMPELIDTCSSMPVLYLRALRSHVSLTAAGDRIVSSGGANAMFMRGSISDYIEAPGLAPRAGGVSAVAQNDSVSGSLISAAAAGSSNTADDNLAWFVIQGAVSDLSGMPADPNDAPRVAPRGSFVLIAPGHDGVYFSKDTAPLPASMLIQPQQVEQFDDVVITGGGG